MHAGFYERRQAEQLTAKIASSQSPDTKPYTKLICGWSNYLYHQKDLPFALENMPDTFSPFRKKIEKYAKSSVLSSELKSLGLLSLKPANLPEYKFRIKQQKGVFDTAIAANDCSAAYGDSYAGQYGGGETAALGRIEDYFFSSDRIAQYKETRNGLDGWQFSSRLSAFLALGCVSPRTVNAKLKEYESQRGANESTYWLYFELLWREFFHLQHIKHGAAFFALGGIQQSQPQTNHKTATFEQWCSGKTGYDIVDACMHQLNATGFMSNRGRQLVASCFVHELQLDWRYGAAYFEQQLVDFDVASNWGNWQYLAGVGSDSRGHRQFNLQKQTDIYDPNHAFIKSWLPSK
jgi:deoxyribodipyrimidine photo-lyase